MQTFDLRDIIARSWRLWREAPLVHAGAALVLLVGTAASAGLATGPLLVGHIRLIDKQMAGHPVRLADLAAAGDKLLASLATWILLAGGTALASMVVVLPGVALALFWSYALWFVALDRVGPLRALAASWRLCTHHLGPTLLVLVGVIAANMVGTVLIVGLLASLPLALIVLTHSFRALSAPASPAEPA
ncbi:MAG: hypothetical protein AAB426_14350 [Myxococcota bacterium]